MAYPANTNPVFGDPRAATLKKVLGRLNEMTALPGGGSTYTRTAIVDAAGNDGTAQLNSDTLRFQTFSAAVAALAAAYPVQTTTVRLSSNIASGAASDTAINELLAVGLTIMSHDATVRTLGGTTNFGTGHSSVLALSKVTITSLAKAAHTTDEAQSAGTITGDANTTITALTLDSDAVAGTAGSNGANGGTVTGSNGADGADGDPPEAGGVGSDANASGVTGVIGSAGHGAWSVTLLGAGNVTDLSARSLSAGGAGGVGGDGSAATGGNGGAGGDSTALILQDGGAGGSGGSAISSGGAGGDGGNGGAGGVVYKEFGWSIMGSDLSGSATGGAGGAGGAPGVATGGSGGAGGTGAFGGATGASGGTGTTNESFGSAGASGSAGANGSIESI